VRRRPPGRLAPERARLLVEECAHPAFRTDLEAYLDRAAEAGGNVPHHLETAFTWRE
jgi:succinyl-CoA:acetate CoA-transferase